MGKPVKEFMGVRVPPDMLDILKGRADSQGVKLSPVVIEALALFIHRIVENRCRICQTKNPEDQEWCGSCGAPLTVSAEIEYRKDVEGIRDAAGAEADEAIAKICERVDARIDRIEALVKTRFLPYEKCPDRPASATPRPADEKTLDIDPE